MSNTTPSLPTPPPGNIPVQVAVSAQMPAAFVNLPQVVSTTGSIAAAASFTNSTLVSLDEAVAKAQQEYDSLLARHLQVIGTGGQMPDTSGRRQELHLRAAAAKQQRYGEEVAKFCESVASYPKDKVELLDKRMRYTLGTCRRFRDENGILMRYSLLSSYYCTFGRHPAFSGQDVARKTHLILPTDTCHTIWKAIEEVACIDHAHGIVAIMAFGPACPPIYGKNKKRIPPEKWPQPFVDFAQRASGNGAMVSRVSRVTSLAGGNDAAELQSSTADAPPSELANADSEAMDATQSFAEFQDAFKPRYEVETFVGGLQSLNVVVPPEVLFSGSIHSRR